MEAPTHNLQDLMDLLLMSLCQILQHTFRGLCFKGSELFWQHNYVDEHTIRQMVLILWLITV